MINKLISVVITYIIGKIAIAVVFVYSMNKYFKLDICKKIKDLYYKWKHK